ncbi:MAG: 2-amino-4-hydroxy-6-hydroxymethyldihydropteridine diphosphokinase [Desulfobacteraceae bacterium]|nr:MAG: 2-amino-4-hydroxy-6-hydroxymethyldihydropteridine diphosphokinase [Desulfobacteraceae bacterium]
MATAYIGIGSNIGDRLKNCARAAEEIAAIPGIRAGNCSEWFLTRPVGVEGQEWYMNGALEVKTDVPPRRLLDQLLEVEKGMGRVRTERRGPRIIDLDLLLFGNEVIREQGLFVPHPLLHLRRFVLVPLVQLAPEFRHPILGKNMAELLRELPEGEQDVVPLKGSECCA